MCGLCGVLGAPDHWTESGGQDRTRRHERLDRVDKLNRVLAHYRLRADDWQGSRYLLSGPTGGTDIVDDVAHLWQAAERMLGARCDPLDPALLRALDRKRQ
jgi:hypothetical protein